MAEEVPSLVDISKLTPQQLIELERRIKETQKGPVFVERVCGLEKDKSKAVLCKMARAHQESLSGWSKYVMTNIEKHLPRK